MKKLFTIFIISTIAAMLYSCNKSDSASRPQLGQLFVFAEDSCYCINYSDRTLFSIKASVASLFYNDVATIRNENNKWQFITKDGSLLIPTEYNKATVFSEGCAWVMKDGDMPGAINNKGEMLISLRDVNEVRVFHESRAAFSITKKKNVLWGFLDKNGEEIIKPQYRTVSNFRLGLSAVQENKDGLWGYINLTGEEVISPQYLMAYPFDDNGHAIVKEENRYLTIDRKGTVIHKHHFDEMIPDGSLIRVRNGELWGWCNSNGEIIIPVKYDANRPFGNASIAPVKIGNKWAYINGKDEIVIKRQFTEAYPLIDGRAAVKAGIMWGYIDEKGCYMINPQYDNVSEDYLQQALGQGCSLSTLRIKK